MEAFKTHDVRRETFHIVVSKQLQCAYGQDITRIRRKVCQVVRVQRLLQRIGHFFFLFVGGRWDEKQHESIAADEEIQVRQ